MFEGIYYSPYVPGLENFFKACLIGQMVSKTMTAGYINKFLTCNIGSGAIYNIQFNPIKSRNSIDRII